MSVPVRTTTPRAASWSPTASRRTRSRPRFTNSRRNRTRAGAGLGLYLVSRIMEAHAGRIEVDSRDGAGTAFTVWLPQVASPPKGLLQDSLQLLRTETVG
ncbi:sensor histidine kinase [Azospirillum argentinense]|uniref:sensor histidine kinase n=1 Tax=Azospirillum argentinense TaxID=2970906 RepID=UPI001FFFF1B0|nr:ATP-binding protein [Azospirillum argentinense]